MKQQRQILLKNKLIAIIYYRFEIYIFDTLYIKTL